MNINSIIVKNPNKIYFMPIGGCNIIGANLYLYGNDKTWIAIDCGIGFSKFDKTPGANITIPDLSLLIKHNIKLDALIITHAHADHIAALKYVFDKIKCPIYATNFSRNWLKNELKPEEFNKLKLNNLEKNFHIGSFDIKTVDMTHSIVEAKAILLQVNNVSVFHTGDWKIDHKPIFGNPIDMNELEEIGKNGVSTLICDSTNATKLGSSRSESELYDSLTEIILNKDGLVLITTFGSNVGRIKTIANVAKRTNRKIGYYGLAFKKIIEVAQNSGYLNDVDIVDLRSLKSYDRNNFIIIVTGCQGEDSAALSKILRGENHLIKLIKGDAVIFSSKTIPGNELDVSDIINQLIVKEVDVITDKDHFVHTSGHPYKEDLLILYDKLKPKCLIPMHGDALMMQAQKELGKEVGIENIAITRNGGIIEIGENNLRHLKEKIDTNLLLVDGKSFINENSSIFQDRLEMGANGVFVCNIIFNDKLKIIDTIINNVAIFETKTNQNIIQNIKTSIIQGINKIIVVNKKIDKIAIEKSCSQVIEKIIMKHFGKNPMIIINISIPIKENKISQFINKIRGNQ